MGAKVIGQDAMLARQGPDGEEPLFQRFQLSGVHLQPAKAGFNPGLRL